MKVALDALTSFPDFLTKKLQDRKGYCRYQGTAFWSSFRSFDNRERHSFLKQICKLMSINFDQISVQKSLIISLHLNQQCSECSTEILKVQLTVLSGQLASRRRCSAEQSDGFYRESCRKESDNWKENLWILNPFHTLPLALFTSICAVVRPVDFNWALCRVYKPVKFSFRSSQK